jgi:hypothetical protein
VPLKTPSFLSNSGMKGICFVPMSAPLSHPGTKSSYCKPAWILDL